MQYWGNWEQHTPSRLVVRAGITSLTVLSTKTTPIRRKHLRSGSFARTSSSVRRTRLCRQHQLKKRARCIRTDVYSSSSASSSPILFTMPFSSFCNRIYFCWISGWSSSRVESQIEHQDTYPDLTREEAPLPLPLLLLLKTLSNQVFDFRWIWLAGKYCLHVTAR